MKENYYLNNNAQPLSGDYEVHKESCKYYYLYISGNNFELIGEYNSEIDAVNEAKKKNPSRASHIDGCAHCCPSAHTK